MWIPRQVHCAGASSTPCRTLDPPGRPPGGSSFLTACVSQIFRHQPEIAQQRPPLHARGFRRCVEGFRHWQLEATDLHSDRGLARSSQIRLRTSLSGKGGPAGLCARLREAGGLVRPGLLVRCVADASLADAIWRPLRRPCFHLRIIFNNAFARIALGSLGNRLSRASG